MEEVRAKLKERFVSGHRTGNERLPHFYTSKYECDRFQTCTAQDDSFTGSFNITGEPEIKDVTIESIQLSEYVACMYDEKWWIGLVDEVSEVEQEVKDKILTFSWTITKFPMAKKT